MIKVILLPRKEESLLRFHPWVFSGAIKTIKGEPKEGERVEVRSSKGDFLGIGHYQIGSIAVRILSFEECDINDNFWKGRIENAYNMRKSLGLIGEGQNTYRLIHGEGDFLPGLIVDIYGNTAVMQAHSIGMHMERELICNAIRSVIKEIKHIYYKSEGTLPYKAEIEGRGNRFLCGGESGMTEVAEENGLRFKIDWLEGQKTGFFVDQRYNRQLLEHYAKDRKVLNMFCYTGGFSVYAMRGGATQVDSVDSSARAIELTDENVNLNFPNDPRHQAHCQDAFRYLDSMNHTYDLIILDPPAFAKHRGALRNALQGYKRLNAKAFERIKSGGILFTFSCSQVVDKEQFRLAVFSAAAQSGRRVRILHQLSQPIDHPINIYHPEGEYLKGLVLWVE